MNRLLVAFLALVAMVVVAAPELLAAPAVEDAPAKTVKEPDVIYVPTPHEVVKRMLDMAQVKKGEVVYDLGCGDGRIVVEAAKRGRQGHRL